MTQWLLDAGAHYGYLIVFLGVVAETTGVPVPGETALLVGAVLAARGRLDPVVVGLVGWSAAFIGPNLGYLVGRRYGDRVIGLPGIRRLYDPRRVAAAERFFDRHGWWAVFASRFVAFLRILTGPLAGMHRMRWSSFLVANAVGGAIWVAAVVVAGLLVGSNLDRAVALVSRAGYVGLALAAVVVAGLIVWRLSHRWRRRAQNVGLAAAAPDEAAPGAGELPAP